MFHRYIRLAGVAAMLWVATAQGAPSTDEKIDQLSEELERLKTEVAKGKGGDSGPSSGGKTTIGGYGELHYNNLDSKKEIDFHRFVLFFGHKFSDRIRFHSEVEIEHAFLKDNSGTSSASKGELEIEQAYIEFDLNQRHRALAGLFLVPVGILNETHEPPTFYGVERNAVENRIIPSTWWEAGVGFKGDIGAGFGYDLAVTSGLQIATTGSSAYNIRSGRKKVSEAPADSLAYTGRLRWTGLPGIELAASLYHQDDINQAGTVLPPISATLAEAHIVVSKGPFAVRALFAQWRLNGGSDTNNPSIGASASSSGSDIQNGWYVEPAYKITTWLGAFARYSERNNRAGDANISDTETRQIDYGVNFWPHPQVVLKADVMRQEGAIRDNGYNLGVGYMF